MAKKYVVIDTNVLVSALITRNENSPTVQILPFLVTGNGKHFPEKPFVVTPSELVEILKQEIV